MKESTVIVTTITYMKESTVIVTTITYMIESTVIVTSILLVMDHECCFCHSTQTVVNTRDNSSFNNYLAEQLMNFTFML